MESKYDKIVIIFGNLDIFFHIPILKFPLLFFENFWGDYLISSYFRNKKKISDQIVSDMFSSKYIKILMLF